MDSGTFRYFLELAYKGTPFCGWQLQPNGITVQGELERVLGLLLKTIVRVTGAGRTDTGVHASYYVAHFDSIRNDLHSDEQFFYKLNQLIPREIAVFRIIPVDLSAHARFDALSRTYHYRIATHKNPFTIDLAYHYYRSLNQEKMNEASAILFQYKDFTSFSKLHGNAKTNLCDITEAHWNTDEDNREICFVITANRFLRNMVRAIVGTLIEVGLEKIPPGELHRIIQSKSRGAAGVSVPPQGLYLAHISYPQSAMIGNH